MSARNNYFTSDLTMKLVVLSFLITTFINGKITMESSSQAAPTEFKLIPNRTSINSSSSRELHAKKVSNTDAGLSQAERHAKRHMQRVVSEINIYLTTAICFVGIIGNLFSLKVFCSTKLTRTSSITYLISLTITDSLFLMVHFLDNTCKEIVTHFRIDFPLNIIDQKVTICRGFSLIRSACRCASPWIIVAFTLERFIIVSYPNHANIISRPLLAKRLVILILVMSVLISLYSPALSGIVYYAKKNSLSSKLYIAYKNTYRKGIFKDMHLEEMFFEKSCDILSAYRSFYVYLTLIYTVIVVVFPLIIVSIFNALLINRLYRAKDQWTSAKLKLFEQEMSYKELRDKKVQIENAKITWMLIFISVSFILLTLPHTVLYFIWTIPKLSGRFYFNISPHLMKFTELLYVLNHSINFFLYTITRHSFRKVLKKQLTCSCYKGHATDRSRKNSFNYIKQLKSRYSSVRHTEMSTKKSSFKIREKPLTAIRSTPDIKISAMQTDVIDYEAYWDIVPMNDQLSKLPNASSTKSPNRKEIAFLKK